MTPYLAYANEIAYRATVPRDDGARCLCESAIPSESKPRLHVQNSKRRINPGITQRRASSSLVRIASGVEGVSYTGSVIRIIDFGCYTSVCMLRSTEGVAVEEYVVTARGTWNSEPREICAIVLCISIFAEMGCNGYLLVWERSLLKTHLISVLTRKFECFLLTLH